MTPLNPCDHEAEIGRSEGQGCAWPGRILAAACFALACMLGMAEGAARGVWRWLKLRKQCAWCGRWTGGSPLPIRGVSHGICRKCKAIELARLRSHQTAFKRISTTD